MYLSKDIASAAAPAPQPKDLLGIMVYKADG